MKRLRFSALILAILLLCSLFVSCTKNPPDNTDDSNDDTENVDPRCSVDILKTGKSDCIVINTGSKVIMIDTGEEENLPTIHSYMKEMDYKRIDALILTHFDKDHIGGASEIISTYEIGTVFESFFFCDSKEYLDYHSAITSTGCKITRLTSNYSFKSDVCEITIDVPKKNKYKEKQDNNSSLIVLLNCGEKRLLFCADAMEIRLAEFLDEEYGQFDFVKLPYHGNYIENYGLFIDGVKPSYAAITCSKKNPSEERTLSFLYGLDVEVYQTRYGQIRIESDGKQIEIKYASN